MRHKAALEPFAKASSQSAPLPTSRRRTREDKRTQPQFAPGSRVRERGRHAIWNARFKMQMPIENLHFPYCIPLSYSVPLSRGRTARPLGRLLIRSPEALIWILSLSAVKSNRFDFCSSISPADAAVTPE